MMRRICRTINGAVCGGCLMGVLAALSVVPAGCCRALAADQAAHEMVLIPAGEFVMGTSPEEAQTLAKQCGVHPTLFLGESPKHRLFVKPFWIDRCPVTNAQYKRFTDATKRHAPYGWQGRDIPPGTGDHPVTCVGWQDADAYARWAGLRLPTEAEWEKAARGTDGRLYPWGSEWRDDATRIDNLAWPQTRVLTTPVGAFPAGASPYGVLDLCGNVAQWTSTPAQPPNPSLGWAWYVVKGAGAALGQRYNFRCSARNFSAHTSRWHAWLGFRCARDAAATDAAAPQSPASAKPPAAPPIPPVDGPRAETFGKEPIVVEPQPGHAGVTMRVPYFPQGRFTSFVPEQVLHARPRWPDIPPGEERSVLGKYYFLKGGPNDLFDRWKKDFGK